MSRMLKCTILIMSCLSSVRSSLNFRVFDFSPEAVVQNLTRLCRKEVHVLSVSYEVCVFGLIGKQNDRPGIWFAETCSTLSFSSLQPLNRNLRNLTESKISATFTMFVFSSRSENQNGKPDRRSRTKIATLAAAWLRHLFDFSLALTGTQQNWQKEDLNLPSLCFQADRKTKITALSSH